MPSNSTAKPPRNQERIPAGPAMAETWLAANNQPEPKMAPRPMKVRSSNDSCFLNLPDMGSPFCWLLDRQV
ncbi:hypothetical protein D3C76_1728990 [compost metagenome]